MSDPAAVKEALEAAVDAFNEDGHGIPAREPAVELAGTSDESATPTPDQESVSGQSSGSRDSVARILYSGNAVCS